MDFEKFKEIVTCSVCLGMFDEDVKCPRMLSCGHSFCKSCLEKLLVQRPHCPTCRSAVVFQKIESIPVNFSLISLINFGCPNTTERDYSDCQEDTKEVCKEPHYSSGQPREKKRKLKSEGYCSEHEHFKEFRCMDCEVWICGSCAALVHKQCKTLLVSEAHIELKKRNVFLKLDRKLGGIKEITECFTESLGVLDEEKKFFIQEIQKNELELKDREKRFKELESLKSEQNDYHNKLKQLKATMETSGSDTELSEAMNKFDKLLEEGENQTLKAVGTLCQHKSVFVVDHRYDDTRYGKMAVKDGRIWVSTFRLEKPDAASILIDVEDLLSGSSELPKTVYLQLTPIRDGADAVGSFEVVIETDRLSPRSKNFIFLCSGLKGPSCRGMLLHSFHNFGFLSCQDSNLSAVEGMRHDDVSTPLVEAGLYGMLEENSEFRIQLKDNPFHSLPKFGTIVTGFQLLKDCESVRIIECGLVI